MMYERQSQPNTIGVHSWPTAYRYAGYSLNTRLHRFRTPEGRVELFAKRRSVAGWHIVRGDWCFEYVRGE